MTDLERFREIVESLLGLSCESLIDERLCRVLEQRLNAHGAPDLASYEERLSAPRRVAEESSALAEHLTVGETYFFREPKQIDAFVEGELPLLLRERGTKPVRVLSAGCASGEEAYSLAIMIAERLPGAAASQIQIIGIDVNPVAIRRAKKAQYSAWAFRAAPAGVRERRFVEVGAEAELRPEVRRMVTFEERNLLDRDPVFWREGAFDAIFCRNVLIYMSRSRMAVVIERLVRALAPDGYLFLGHSETLRGLSEEMKKVHARDTFYYRRYSDPPRGSSAQKGAPSPLGSREEPARAAPSKAWQDSLSQASSRDSLGSEGELPPPTASISDRLVSARGEPSPKLDASRSLESAARRDVALALSLFKEERFTEALGALSREGGSEVDPEVNLLIAVIFSHQGRTREAVRLCSRVLSQQGADAGVHYLLGLCREHEGDARAAMRHYRDAIEVDRSFAMPRLRLGSLARRAGDLTTAFAEIRRAADLLPREREGRILLFGGGFQREALLTLCQTELRFFGGRG